MYVLLSNAAEILKWFVMQHYCGSSWLMEVARRYPRLWLAKRVGPALKLGFWGPHQVRR